MAKHESGSIYITTTLYFPKDGVIFSKLKKMTSEKHLNESMNRYILELCKRDIKEYEETHNIIL